MRKTELLSRFSITEDEFNCAGLDWKELKKIEKDYEKIRPTLDSVGRFAIDQMIGSPSIHSLNYRLKDTNHLIEKIIRKRLEDSSRVITLENYKDEITDLVGIRALHLFKEDWQGIHKYICENWDLAEKPVAYVRYGDSKRITDYYHNSDCLVQEHKFGYRSVHYLLRTRPKNEDCLVEVQVRTLFEEAWGEIDHRVRYPQDQDNELLVRLSSILNRLAGDADELGSYMRYFRIRDKRRQREHQKQLDQKNEVIEKLKIQIAELAIDSNSKMEISRNLEDLSEEKADENDNDMDFPWLNSFLDSELFKGLQNSLNDYFSSSSFKPIDISEKELKLILEAQKELVGAMGDDPAKLLNMLSENNGENLLVQIPESHQPLGDEEK
ncbi:MAG: RelA/SpoT domain-containing protein [Spirochaetales bacterium]|nr:RelA/SpoT domain-containing protein [Spirochaetales bacterium]